MSKLYLSIILMGLFNSFLSIANGSQIELHVGIASNFSEVSSSNSNPFGNYFYNGILLAKKQREAELKNKKINLIVDKIDYGVDQLNVIPALEKAQLSKNSIAVIGYNYSSHALIAAPFHQKIKIPMLTPSATATRLSKFDSYVHPTCFNNEQMGKVLSKVALNELKAKRVVSITAVDCAYCQDLTETFKATFEASGGHFSKIEILDNDSDFSAVIQKLKKEKIDVILIPNHELTSARIIAALLDAHINVPFLGGDGWGNVGEEFFGITRDRPLKGYSVSHWFTDANDPKSIKFKTEYLTQFKKAPNDTSVLAYDAMNYLMDVILENQAYTPETLEKALNKKKVYEAISGKTIFNHGLVESKNLIILKVSPNKFQFFKKVDTL